jgi:hypothetical protein
MKFFLMKVIKYIISYLVPVPVPLVKKLRFLRFRFRFHNTGRFSPHTIHWRHFVRDDDMSPHRHIFYTLCFVRPVNRNRRQLESPISCPASSRKGVGKRIADESNLKIEKPNKNIYPGVCRKDHLTILYPVLKKEIKSLLI